MTTVASKNDKGNFDEQKPNKEKEKKYIPTEMRILRVLGVSFNDDESIAYKIYSYIFLFINFAFPTMQFREFFRQEFEVVADMCIYVISITVAMAKTVVVIRNRTTFRKMLERLDYAPFIANVERGGAKEVELIKECRWVTGIQTIGYFCCGYSTIFSNMIYCFYLRLKSSDSKDWQLPFGPLGLLDVTKSPQYEITLFYECLGFYTLATHFFAIDLLMANMLLRISYQFRILQNMIRRVKTNCFIDLQKEEPEYVRSLAMNNKVADFEIDGSAIPYKYLNKHLKLIVEYHLAIANLANDMEEVFSTLLLTIFLSTMEMLCFCIYCASIVEDNLRVMINLLDTTTISFQIFLVSYWGEQIVFHSQEVGRAVYESNFYGTDLRFQKSLAFIIRRSQNPTKLTAGKFADICLATYMWIVRASYSAFMVVRGSASDKHK